MHRTLPEVITWTLCAVRIAEHHRRTWIRPRPETAMADINLLICKLCSAKFLGCHSQTLYYKVCGRNFVWQSGGDWIWFWATLGCFFFRLLKFWNSNFFGFQTDPVNPVDNDQWIRCGENQNNPSTFFKFYGSWNALKIALCKNPARNPKRISKQICWALAL